MRNKIIAVLALVLTACESAPPYDPMLPLTELTANQWNEIAPGHDTICSRGTDWAFFVYPGDPDKVLVEFEGGGACWNDVTCAIGSSQNYFKEDIEQSRALAMGTTFTGLQDHSNADNPFKDWTHVYVPYCTGDIHWGSATKTYSEGTPSSFTINHLGANNARSVLHWLDDQSLSPSNIFVTGCSAGAYGSIYWTPHLSKQYPDAYVAQMGDCGAGIITDTFLTESFPQWNATANLPEWVEGLHPDTIDIPNLNLYDIYSMIAAGSPGPAITAQYNTVLDNNQVFYYTAMGGKSGETGWSQGMLDSIKRIDDASSNFRYFIAPGDRHCIIRFDEVYTLTVGDQKLIDWIAALANGENTTSVACSDCEPALKAE